MYHLILSRPGAVWTAADVAAQLAFREGLAVETIRGILYQLAADGILQTQRAGKRLQFTLDSSGQDRLSAIVEEWHQERSLDPPPPVVHTPWTMVTLNGRRLWLANAPTHRCVPTADAIARPERGCRWCQDRALVVVSPAEGGPTGVMTLTGALVSATSAMVCEAVAAVLRAPMRVLVIEATGVGIVDGHALHTLTGIRRSAKAEGRALTMRHREPNSIVARRLQQAGLLRRAESMPKPVVPHQNGQPVTA
jgi:anti-anti-sigma regulatory factor